MHCYTQLMALGQGEGAAPSPCPHLPEAPAAVRAPGAGRGAARWWAGGQPGSQLSKALLPCRNVMEPHFLGFDLIIYYKQYWCCWFFYPEERVSCVTTPVKKLHLSFVDTITNFSIKSSNSL